MTSKLMKRCSALLIIQFSSVELLSHVQLFVTPWTAACQASPSTTNSQSLPKLMSIELVMPSNHHILCCPLILLPLNLPQHQGLFKWVSSPHQVPKYWTFSFNISPSNEHPGLISFRMNWFIIREMQIKTTMRYHLTPARMVIIKSL